jgi:threonine/homoserine/homoserine lactone efflux protein
MIIKGFKFGMMLQLAVGPICIFIFNLGCAQGFNHAELGVIAVTCVDALFILLAIFGITSLITKESIRQKIKYFGALIVFLFGLNIILDVFHIGFLNTGISFGNYNLNNPFIKGALLTAANPLTILFWVGVFSAKLAESNNCKKDSYLFGLGATLSTFLFLTCVAFLSSYITTFMSENSIAVLNVLVGIALIIFSFFILKKK